MDFIIIMIIYVARSMEDGELMEDWVVIVTVCHKLHQTASLASSAVEWGNFSAHHLDVCAWCTMDKSDLIE